MRWRPWLATIALAAACSKPSQDNNEAKQWPAPPPTPDQQLAKDISIAVTVDGSVKPPITGELLRTKRPDFVDTDRKAWRVATLVGAIGEVEASGPTGIAVKFPAPTAELEPVLFLTRRGDIIVQVVDPKDPFPGHHGQGGRLHRPGDSLPRVEKVAKLEIKRSTP